MKIKFPNVKYNVEIEPKKRGNHQPLMKISLEIGPVKEDELWWNPILHDIVIIPDFILRPLFTHEKRNESFFITKKKITNLYNKSEKILFYKFKSQNTLCNFYRDINLGFNCEKCVVNKYEIGKKSDIVKIKLQSGDSKCIKDYALLVPYNTTKLRAKTGIFSNKPYLYRISEYKNSYIFDISGMYKCDSHYILNDKFHLQHQYGKPDYSDILKVFSYVPSIIYYQFKNGLNSLESKEYKFSFTL